MIMERSKLCSKTKHSELKGKLALVCLYDCCANIVNVVKEELRGLAGFDETVIGSVRTSSGSACFSTRDPRVKKTRTKTTTIQQS